MASKIWKGTLIEESLDDSSILSFMKIVETKTTTLEGETQRGTFHFHHVEIPEESLRHVIGFVTSHIQKPGWYFHLVNGSEIIIVFANKVFTIHKDKPNEVENARQYGLTQGVLKEQLLFEYLFENPFG